MATQNRLSLVISFSFSIIFLFFHRVLHVRRHIKDKKDAIAKSDNILGAESRQIEKRKM